jgi:hypothetical protein
MTYGGIRIVSSNLKFGTVWGYEFQAPAVLLPRRSKYCG